MVSSFALVGVAFWVFMAAVVISEDIGKTKRRAEDLNAAFGFAAI